MTFLNKKTQKSIPIVPVTAAGLKNFLQGQNKSIKSWIASSGFKADRGSLLSVPNTKGKIIAVLWGMAEQGGLYAYADLPTRLPYHPDGYYIDARMSPENATKAALGWALGSYQFTKYKPSKAKKYPSLVWPDNADKLSVQTTWDAVFLVRDLVNTPANDLGPAELASAAQKVAKQFKKTSVNVIAGEELLRKNYPAVYAVGKGSTRKPHFIDIRWGDSKNPMVTLIGKGVCFDTGGLNIKTSGMAMMKKDMGGAAIALALAQMIMAHNLPVRLRVLIPAVENSIGGNSYRPSDVIQTRKGISVEVGDTDAEGRIILSDALAEASREKPALIIDFATLTGAARVALGPELPAMFCNNDKIAEALLETATKAEDPLWRMPLWQPYKEMLNSKIADTNNISPGGNAGAVTAALFLEKFVGAGIPWVHLDTFAWNSSSKPGRPEGGEALGMRACFELIKTKFTKKKH